MKDLKIVILKDAEKEFRTKFVSVDKMNANYNKYISDPHNEYFIIPVSNISNLFLIYDRQSMPQAFMPMHIEYTLEILKIKYLAEMTFVGKAVNSGFDTTDYVLHQQKMSVDINTPHDLFTFLYNLEELLLFNTLMNDDRSFVGLNGDMYVYSVSEYHMKGSWIDKTEQINRIPDLIEALQRVYSMVRIESYAYDIRLNSDGSCAYSDPTKIYSNRTAELCGNTQDKDAIVSLRLPIINIPIYTFIKRSDENFLNDINVYYSGRGNIMFFMGTEFDMNCTSIEGTFMSDETFSMCKVSSILVNDMVDMVIYIKVAMIMMRIAYQLVHIKDRFQTFDGWVPSFRYEVNTRWMNDKADKLVKTYTIRNEDDILKIDPYESFMQFLEDVWIPF
jgi:hypothetical protein